MGRCTRQCVERPMTNAGVSTAYQLPSTKGASHGLRTTTWPMRRPTNGGALHRRCAFKPNLTVPPFRNLPRTQQPAQHDIQTTNMPPELSMLAPVTHDRFERLQRQYGSDLTLAVLVDDGAGRLPLPGSGETLKRWQALATVAAHDLALVKLFEGHTDASAILEELGGDAPSDGSLWATWCAEPPDARVVFEAHGNSANSPLASAASSLSASSVAPPVVRLYGTKAWCSGAASVTHAVVSGWNAAGDPCLAAVSLQQPSVTVTEQGWQAIGMAGSASVDVRFDGAHATQLGAPGDYTRRIGFWHGGAGIAACWYGGAWRIAQMVRELSQGSKEPHRLAHLGAIDVALMGAAAVLRASAVWIDTHPGADAQVIAMRARLAVEGAAEEVIRHAGRALGAGPLCRNARFARAMADLPVFLRQSHAERDLASLGTLALDARAAPWML